jgi:hypothetical protein
MQSLTISSMPIKRGPFIAIAFLGLATLVALSFMIRRNLVFIHSSTRASATVVANVTVMGNRGVTYRPRFAFQTADGRNVIVTSGSGSNPAGFHVGEQVGVIYDPANPHNARIDTIGQVWEAEIILGFMGIFFTAIPAWALTRRTTGTPPPPRPV